MESGQAIGSNSEHTNKESAEFEIRSRRLIIHMKEDLDHHNAIAIREYADKLLISKGIQHVIFDFSSVKFMDSSGIGVIVGRYKKLKLVGGGCVAVCGVRDSIKRIFLMSGLYSIVESYDTVSAAEKQLELQNGRYSK